MNKIDDLKLLRLQEEKKFINNELIETLAQGLVSSLVEWANKKIFAPLGGELKFDITIGPPNAGVLVNPNRPLYPHMEFRTSLISDIYADAFAFPIICRRLAMETDTLSYFNSMEIYRDCRVRFTDPLPHFYASNLTELFRPICETFVELISAQKNEQQPRPDEVRSRFIMFELMLVWTFFHELGHVVQGHHLLRSERPPSIYEDAFWEMKENAVAQGDSEGMSSTSQDADKSTSHDLPAQARELLADAEATVLTLKYLVEQRRFHVNVWYLFLCSTGCMFQRFYSMYPDNLDLSPGRHPHPFIRDHANQILSNNWVADFLVANKNIKSREEAHEPLIYLSTRASLMTGLFRANRMEKREDLNQLPSYMELSVRNNGEQQRAYLKALLPEIEWQLPIIVKAHLIEPDYLEYWLQRLRTYIKI